MKYPRTMHLPNSPGVGRDDRALADLSGLLGRELVFAEKLDGQNVALRAESPHPFARSHSGTPPHPSFAPLKAIHAALRPSLPAGATVYGEWCYAVVSSVYGSISDDVWANLFLIAVRYDGGRWGPWEEVEGLALSLGLHAAPVLGRRAFLSGSALTGEVARLGAEPSALGGVREGVVVRDAGGFGDAEFPSRVAKWVRAGFRPGERWSKRSVLTHRGAREEDLRGSGGAGAGAAR